MTREMKRGIFFAVLVFTLGLGAAQAQQVKVAIFDSPPLMGASKLSSEGLQVELLRAAFKTVGLEPKVDLMPQARAIAMLRSGEYPVMVGTTAFFMDIKADVVGYPLTHIRMLLFYLKEKHPDFSWKDYPDLQQYSIAVMLGGAADRVIAANKLKNDNSNNQEQIFRKIEAGRVDLGIGTDLGGWLIIDDVFPGQRNKFGSDDGHAFLSIPGEIVLSRKAPNFADLDAKIRAGVKNIYKSGEWKTLLEKYYGKGKIPAETQKMLADFAK